jgi:phosphotransacetylase
LSAVLERIRERARQRQATIVLPESDDPRVVAAAAAWVADGLGQVVLVGERGEQRERAGVRWAAPRSDPRCGEWAAALHERRAAKGMDRRAADAFVRTTLGYGAALLAAGDVQAGVAGSLAATAEVIRAGLLLLGLEPGVTVCSSFFLMAKGEQVFSFADCGVVPDPDPEQLCSSAAGTAETQQLLTSLSSNSSRNRAAHRCTSELNAIAQGALERLRRSDGGEEITTIVAAIDEVINGSGKLDAKPTCHHPPHRG